MRHPANIWPGKNIATIYSLLLEATLSGLSHDTHRVFKSAMYSKAFAVALLLVGGDNRWQHAKNAMTMVLSYFNLLTSFLWCSLEDSKVPLGTPWLHRSISIMARTGNWRYNIVIELFHHTLYYIPKYDWQPCLAICMTLIGPHHQLWFQSKGGWSDVAGGDSKLC